jgi:hypothetical protein
VNQAYAVRFRARADEPRDFSVGFARAHDPWTGLGLYQKRVVTSEWGEFEELFLCQATDDNARIHFDLGGSCVPIEIADVRLDPV